MEAEKFKKTIQQYSDSELFEIHENMDKEKYPENYKILESEIFIRKSGNQKMKSIPENTSAINNPRYQNLRIAENIANFISTHISFKKLLHPSIVIFIIYTFFKIDYATGTRSRSQGNSSPSSFNEFKTDFISGLPTCLTLMILAFILHYIVQIYITKKKTKIV